MKGSPVRVRASASLVGAVSGPGGTIRRALGAGVGDRSGYRTGRPELRLVGRVLDDRAARRRAVLDDRTPAAREVAGAGPRGPENHREHEAEDADTEHDPTNGLDVDPAGRCVHREGQDGPDCDEKNADSDSHEFLLVEHGRRTHTPDAIYLNRYVLSPSEGQSSAMKNGSWYTCVSTIR